MCVTLGVAAGDTELLAGGLQTPPEGQASRRRPGSGCPGPPRSPGDSGGGGGGGDGWDEGGWRDPSDGPFDRSNARPPGTSELGFWFFLTSIGTLFLIFLGGYIVLHNNAESWPGRGVQPPRGLLGSTLVLVASSLAFSLASRAQRRDDERAVQRWLALTAALGCAFLVTQALLWRAAIRAGLTTDLDAYGAVFFSLTGLHALHVLGGLVYLFVLLFLSRRPRSFEAHPLRLRFGAIYWHFMGAIWIVLFSVLYVLR